MVLHHEDFNTAITTYTLLTIGDGLISQLPALLVSTATGIIVTRANSEGHLRRRRHEAVLAERQGLPRRRRRPPHHGRPAGLPLVRPHPDGGHARLRRRQAGAQAGGRTPTRPRPRPRAPRRREAPCGPLARRAPRSHQPRARLRPHPPRGQGQGRRPARAHNAHPQGERPRHGPRRAADQDHRQHEARALGVLLQDSRRPGRPRPHPARATTWRSTRAASPRTSPARRRGTRPSACPRSG